MKKFILLAALIWMISMPQIGMTATNTASTNIAECLFCTQSPAKRYAKAHKSKKFNGYKMSKQAKKAKRQAKRNKKQ